MVRVAENFMSNVDATLWGSRTTLIRDEADLIDSESCGMSRLAMISTRSSLVPVKSTTFTLTLYIHTGNDSVCYDTKTKRVHATVRNERLD